MPKTKRRNIIAACLLALLQPGLGFLYVGWLWLALAVPVAPFALLFLTRLSGLALLPWGMLACGALIVVAWVGGIVWCGFEARKAGETALAWYQRWYVYLGYYVSVSAFFSFGVDNALDWVGARVYRIQAASMSDTLQRGDYVVADSWAYLLGRKPKRGEIVIFTFPTYPDVRYAKRIIGLPGERVEVRGYRVYINDSRLDEPYINAQYNATGLASWKYVVPAGSYVVLGDNRDHSEDSRALGAVPAKDIFGRARAICMSVDPKRGLHFDRAGNIM